jgi:tetratricopeptide (TPR) repeat protein
LKPRVYLPAREGSLQPELLAAARSYHRIAYVLRPDLGAVLREVRAGHPVLVLQNLAFNWYPRWHYAVVIGYDLDRRELILHSGTVAREVLSLRTFEYTWRRGGHWAVVMLPAEELPATAEEMDYLQAVLALEQGTDWSTAAAAYRTATARWPASPGAWFGLGNAYYRLNDYAAAEAAFRQVLEVRPDHAAAFNNLAYVLLQRGRLDEARQAAERATTIDAGNPDYQATLREILQAISDTTPPAAGD